MRNLCAALLLTLTLTYSASAGIMEAGAPAPASAGVMECDAPAPASTGVMECGSPSDELSAALLQALLTIAQSGTP